MDNLNVIVAFSSLINFLLGALVFIKGKIKSVSYIFAFFAWSVGFWSLATFYFWFSDRPLVWGRVMFIGPILMAPLFMQFALLFPNKGHLFTLKRFLLILFPALPFIGLTSTDVIVKEVLFSNREVVYGVGNSLFGAYFSIYFLGGFLFLLQGWRYARGITKVQYEFLFLGIFICTVIGVTTNLILPLMGTSLYNRVGPSSTVFFVGMVTFTILRHKLMDIELIIKKTLVFTGLFGLLMVVAIGLSALLQSFTGINIDQKSLIFITFTVAFAMVIHDPAKTLLINLTDRFLFQKTQDFRQILTKLSHEVITVLDLDKVGKVTLNTFENALHLESGAILMKSEDGKAYKVLDAFGLERELEPLDPADPLVTYFSYPDKIVNLDLEDEVPDFVRKAMQDFRARVMVALFFQAQLIGLLALGRKKSDQEYTRQEMDYFPAISAQIAVALSNAREVELRKKNQAEYYQQTKLAAIGIMASGIAHELKNPLQIIRGCLGLVDSGFKKGYYKGMPYDEMSQDALEAIRRTFEGVDRADKIVARLNHVSKKQVTQKVQLVNVEEPLDEVIEMVEHDFGLRGITISKHSSPDIPPIMADYDILIQIFLNFLANARDAILQHPEVKEKKIDVDVRRTSNELKVSFRDSGIGIKPEDREKLFSPFFTTKDVTRNDNPNAIKGTGLGLHLVRQMVSDLKGYITVESEYMRGTTFYVCLPVGVPAEANGNGGVQ